MYLCVCACAFCILNAFAKPSLASKLLSALHRILIRILIFLCCSRFILVGWCSVKSTDDLIDSSTKENSDNSNATHGNCDNYSKLLMCQLCNYKASHILGMMQHVKSLRHMQIEQLICFQRMNENLDTLDLAEVYKVIDTGKFLVLLLFYFLRVK